MSASDNIFILKVLTNKGKRIFFNYSPTILHNYKALFRLYNAIKFSNA